MKRVRVVAALISDPVHGERYLVQQRLSGASRGGLWEFPGGKVEEGESDPEALKRECQEELAVTLAVGDRLWGTVHAYDDLVVELELYAAWITAGHARPVGAQALRYCTPSDMRALPFCEADVPLIDALARGLGARASP